VAALIPNLTGTCSITNPKETVTENFPVGLDWTRFQTPSIVGSLGYPASITVGAPHGFSFVGVTFAVDATNFVSGTVDGFAVSSGIPSIDLFARDYSPGTEFPARVQGGPDG